MAWWIVKEQSHIYELCKLYGLYELYVACIALRIFYVNGCGGQSVHVQFIGVGTLSFGTVGT